MQEENFISLSLLNQLIKETVQGNFMEDLWLVAEIADVRSAASGHCYLELVEKKNDKILARIKANIWSYQYSKIAGNFFAQTNKQLEKGMKILLLAGVTFHELYGMSLIVKDVNPSFTLGSLEQAKRLILERLKKEQLLDKNKALDLELLPKRIAVISSTSAAGFEDFMNQLKEQKHYCFEVEHFEAVMQGDQVEGSVISALQKIKNRVQDFDSVAIIRGGGASLDLSGFDNYVIAAEVANFPLPVLSGVGHERDFTVLDYVVHTRLKTPTAVAAFYIQQFDEFSDHVKELKEALLYVVQDKLFKETKKTSNYRSNFAFICQSFLNQKKQLVNKQASDLAMLTNKSLQEQQLNLLAHKKAMGLATSGFFKQRNTAINVQKDRFNVAVKNTLLSLKKELVNYQKTINLVDPATILERGFAIVKRKDGSFVKSSSTVKPSLDLTLQLKDGEVQVVVKK